jgi:hypothetical protein
MARRPFLALLDPALAGSALAEPATLVVPPPPPRAPRSRSSIGTPPAPPSPPLANALTLGPGFGCGVARTGPSSLWALVALLALGVARRALSRRALVLGALALVLGALACGARRPEPPGPPPAPVASGGDAPRPAATLAVGPVAEDVSPGKLEEYELPTSAPERQRALMRLLAGHHEDRLIPVRSTPEGRGIGRSRNSASSALPDAAMVERRCAADPRVEGTLRYTVDSDAAGATRALAEGRRRGRVVAGVAAALASAGPRIGRGAETGFLSLGTLGPDTVALRRSIKAAKVAPRRELLPSKVRRVSSTVSAGLPRAVVDRVMRANFSRFRSCYERERHPAKKGTVKLDFAIGPAGSAVSMAASAADVSGATGICLGNAVRSLAFPRPEGGQTVKVSVVLGFERAK